MKKTHCIKFLAFLGIVAFSVSCIDEDTKPAPYDVGVDNVPNGAYLSTIEVTSDEINIDDITGSTFAVDLEYNGGELNDISVFLTLTDNSIEEGGEDISTTEALYETLPSSDVSSSILNYVDGTGDAVNFLGLADSDIGPGDVLTYRFQVNLSSGISLSNNNTNSNIISEDAYRSPFVYDATAVCPPVPPTPGEWTIVQNDSYGDSWNGASMTVTIDGESVDYTHADGAGSSTTHVFSVPPGALALQITYNAGSFDEENTFTVTSGDGTVVLDLGPTPPTGALFDYCLDDLDI